MNPKFQTPMAVLVAALTFATAAARVAPGKPEAMVAFTRLVHTGKTTVALETRAVKLVPSDGKGPIVWLVGAAHIGQPSYYKALQNLLDEQSLVLYEGVRREERPATSKVDSNIPPKPNGTFPDKNKSTYLMFANAVGLDFQLNDIDYSRKTFKNSDLTWAQVSALSQKQSTKAATTMSQIGRLMDSDSPEGKAFSVAMNAIKADPGSREAMRVVLAEGLSKPGLLEGLLGEGTSEVLISSRNAKVLGDLEKDSSYPSIAIFFGAAHMPEMKQRLILERHYHEVQERWFRAITGDEAKVSGMGAIVLAQFRTMMGIKKPSQ